MNLQELRQKRLKWVEANRENGFDDSIKRLLTDLYPDNAHFIYELLQNAEDARASEVRFILKKDGVEFEHNGDRLFSIKDVEAITSMGISTKKDDPTNIGKFGVGFKAVFAYTSTPEIKSGEYHFRIRDLVVPDTEGLTSLTLGENETRFLFPFDNPQKPPERAYEEIENNLRQLDESTLVFLSNIKKIEYLLPDSTLGFMERKETDGDRIEILVQHPEDSDPASVIFLRFEKQVDVLDENDKLKSCRIAAAFGLEKTKEQNWKIKPLEPGRVCIYFPAEKETSNLRFHLHAPFASTVARDSVRDCPANDGLRDHLAELVVESMSNIRDQGLLDVAFLATLPNDKDNLSSFYKPIMKRLIEAFNYKKLTPMKQGGHAAASWTFRGQARLSNLISDSDLVTILGEDYSPPIWITNPPQLNQREDNFLSMLYINEWTTEDLVNELSANSESIMKWLAEKPDEWHQRLYALLGNFLSTERRDELSGLLIIRCSDGEYRVGSECYFPSDDVVHDDQFPHVAKGVYSSGTNEYQQKAAREFLKEIGVKELDEARRVEAILKAKYICDEVEYPIPKRYHKDIRRFIKLVENDPEQASLFQGHAIFQSEDRKWRKPEKTYIDSPYVDTGLGTCYCDAYCNNLNRKWALSEYYKVCGIEPERIGKFAEAVGAQTKLEPKKQKISSKHPEWWDKLRDSGGWSSRYGIDEDYDIPEFDILLNESDLTKSKFIWNAMSKLPDHVLKARYRSNSWHYEKTANSSLVWKLRKHRWIPQKQDAEKEIFFVKPSNAVAKLLPPGFGFDRGAKWLDAIVFGKAEREHEEAERRKKEQATQEYQWKSKAAETLGFSSVEEAQDAARMLKEDPSFISRWKAEKQKPRFPEKESQNLKRREKQLRGQVKDAPEKEYETRERSTRITRGEIEPDIYLRNQYTNQDDQLICQICKEEMPFKKRDGEYYFEAVEALSRDYFHKEHRAQFLALCPECAARYKEFVKRDKSALSDLYHALMKDSDKLEVLLKLGEKETSLQFVETHWQDMKTILQIPVVDRRDTWNEQDKKDLTTTSLQYGATLYPEEDLV